MSEAIETPRNESLPAEKFLRSAVFFLVVTSVVMLISTGKLDLFSCVVAPVALLYKGYRWWRNKTPEISQTLATRLVVGYVAIFPIDVLFLSRSFVADSTNPGLYAALLSAVHFLLFVMLVRLFSARTDRDTQFLALLTFAAILASAVLTVDTTFLVLFFVFMLCVVAVFMCIELRRGAFGALFPPWDTRTSQERRVTRALGLAALSVTVGAGILGGLLFFIFPRVSAGYMGRAGFQPMLLSGFSDDVELGEIGQIKKDSTVVMHVETGKPVAYPMLRWRGIALTNFDGSRWFTPRNSLEPLIANADGWIYVAESPVSEASRSGAGLQYTILLQPMAADVVFTAGKAISVQGSFLPEGTNSTWDGTRQGSLTRDSTGSLFNPSHNFSPLRYSAYSLLPNPTPARLRSDSTNYPPEIQNIYLQLPKLDPRIPDLAQKITAGSLTAYDKTAAIETYLRSHYSYTLNLTGKQGEDPLAYFLFQSHAGHCEYFASAMAILTRTLGIPTREINGFLPGEYNDLGNDYIVRGSDAHSWVEVYFPGDGWVTFDPTPAAPEIVGLMSRLGKYLDWAELSWNEWIINYDFKHQMQVAQGFQRNSRTWREYVHEWLNRIQQKSRDRMSYWQARHGELGIVVLLLLILFVILQNSKLLTKILRRISLQWQLRASHSERANPQLASRLYDELLRLLERRGIKRSVSQTPLEFAGTVAEPGLAPAVREFTQLYSSARFGHLPCDTPRLRLLLSQISAAKASR